jgi:hypothetical protein
VEVLSVLRQPKIEPYENNRCALASAWRFGLSLGLAGQFSAENACQPLWKGVRHLD